MEHLQDRVAVVTGAASGLGWAMSKRFAGAGMKVVLADIEADRLDAAVRELRACRRLRPRIAPEDYAGSPMSAGR
jgi:NAD(P)-dependent dehydrogenase (short-subunit alcohol dehydrogenase family)